VKRERARVRGKSTSLVKSSDIINNVDYSFTLPSPGKGEENTEVE
jgi:hypothetical protein